MKEQGHPIFLIASNYEPALAIWSLPLSKSRLAHCKTMAFLPAQLPTRLTHPVRSAHQRLLPTALHRCDSQRGTPARSTAFGLASLRYWGCRLLLILDQNPILILFCWTNQNGCPFFFLWQIRMDVPLSLFFFSNGCPFFSLFCFFLARVHGYTG